MPRQVLDPDDPVTIGAMVGPEAFTEVRYLMHAKQMQALDAIPRDRRRVRARRSAATSGGLVAAYRTEDAETVVVALGSVLGTIEDVVDELRDEGDAIGALGDHLLPPVAARRGARGARRRASASSCSRRRFAVGVGGIVGQNVRLALSRAAVEVHDVVAGLGGRPITAASLHGLLARRARGPARAR